MLVVASGCVPQRWGHNLVAISTDNDRQQLFSSGEIVSHYGYRVVLSSCSKIPDDIRINFYDTELELVNKVTGEKSLYIMPSTYTYKGFGVVSNEVGFIIFHHKPYILAQCLSDKESDFYMTFYFETAGAKIPARFSVGKEFFRREENPFFRAFDEKYNPWPAKKGSSPVIQ